MGFLGQNGLFFESLKEEEDKLALYCAKIKGFESTSPG